MHNHNRKQKRRMFNIPKIAFNQQIRRNCCWNCFGIGHIRFQCPFPKVTCCSYCRRPGIQTRDCLCIESRLSYNVPEHKAYNQPPSNNPHPLRSTEYGCFLQNVIVPVNDSENNNTEYVEKDNIVIVIPNQEVEDLDYIEIHPEEDCLDNI